MLHPTAIAAILLSGLLAAPAANNVPEEALGAVNYEVRYLLGGINTKVAEATISLENATRDGQPVLHSHAVITAQAIFKLFLNSEYIADAYMSPGGEEPIYSINPIKKGKKEGKFECIYDKKAGTITSEFAKPSAKPVILSLPYDGLTMDMLSLVQFVRFLDHQKGKSYSMHLLAAGRANPAILTCEGPDKERFPEKNAVRYHLSMTERGLMENGSGNEITVWVSNEKDRRILGLETALSSGVMSVSVK